MANPFGPGRRKKGALDERIAAVVRTDADAAPGTGVAADKRRKLTKAEQAAVDKALAKRAVGGGARKPSGRALPPPPPTGHAANPVATSGVVPSAADVARLTASAVSDRAIHIPANLSHGSASRAIRSTTAVMTQVTVKGDPDELLGAYHAYQQSVDERGGPAPGLLSHTCAATHEGLLVVEVWSSEAALKAWLARTPGQHLPKVYKVHGLRTAPLQR